jgi:hypothetical protein
MIKRTIPVIAAMLAVAGITPLAQGATTTHQLKLTVEDVTINAHGDQPGDRQTTAGLVSGNPFGDAVESINDKVTSATSNGITLTGTLTIYTSRGTITAAIKFKVTPKSAGGATGIGRANITGGTGTYGHARGSFTFSGAEKPNSPLFISHATGTIAY